MTSKITTVYGAYNTWISGILTSYKKLPNPYSSEDNSELLLKKGYGIAIGPGENTNRYFGCKHSTKRTFAVILTNQVTVTDHNVTGHATAELSLLEDAYLLRKAVETDPTLLNSTTKTLYQDDTGIEFVENDRFKFFKIVVNFVSEYIEDN
jgi:hypothetical protein